MDRHLGPVLLLVSLKTVDAAAGNSNVKEDTIPASAGTHFPDGCDKFGHDLSVAEFVN